MKVFVARSLRGGGLVEGLHRLFGPLAIALMATCLIAGTVNAVQLESGLGRVVRYPVSRPGKRGLEGVNSVIGAIRVHVARSGETFLDIARDYSLGYNELLAANPDVDPWVVGAGRSILIPSEWILPDGRYQGLVLNVPEMRIYYYLPLREGRGQRVVTFPVGLGRQEWQTPRGDFRIRGKSVNPTWVIPESIRKERLEEDGLTETFIAGGDPENPLGKYRLELTLPSYAIHGTNKNWGIGMKVSHGCVRMYAEDIEAFFPLVGVGSSGSFVYQPVKVGVADGRVLIEVHEDIYGVARDPAQQAASLLAKKGLSRFVDTQLLEAALAAASGIPTDIGTVSMSRVGF